ncbi:MAG TPA: helix-turn-helix domain-containing protein [bacterium]|nr:helix-turn-helix domain-containing protein [bacterium]
MRRDKKERLERAGWKVGDAKEFLDLSDGEMAVIEVRVSLARELRRQRLARKLSQAALAKQIGSSQSRVAKMEAGDPSVSIDLLLRSLFTSGSSSAAIGRAIARTGGARSHRSRTVAA